MGSMAYIQNILPGSSIFFFVYLFIGSGSSVFYTYLLLNIRQDPAVPFSYH